MRLTTAKYITLDQQLTQVPPFLRPVGTGPLTSHENTPVYLYRFEGADPYAYLVPQAVKVPEEQILPTLSDPRSSFDPRRLLLVPSDAPAGVDVSTLRALPEPIATPVAIQEPHAGRFRFTLGAPAPAGSYLFVSENWYPAWHARVDGRDAPVLRAQFTLIGVPLTAGARDVALWVADRAYAMGKVITVVALLGVLALAVWGIVAQRTRGIVRG
jgi:hypothetical protein